MSLDQSRQFHESFGSFIKDTVTSAVREGVRLALDEKRRAELTSSEVLTPRQVARLAKVADQTVYEAIKSGRLPSIKSPAGRFLVQRSIADEWVRAYRASARQDDAAVSDTIGHTKGRKAGS